MAKKEQMANVDELNETPVSEGMEERENPDIHKNCDEAVESTIATESVAALQEEIASLKDQYLRKSAEFENFRKRLLKDKEESIRYANTRLLTDLLEIIDNFERAITSGETNKDFKTFFDGIGMIENQLTSMLDTKYGLKKMESKGFEFDPQFHEAIAILPSPTESEKQMVLEEVQTGYLLGDRVLRPAKVVVSKTTE